VPTTDAPVLDSGFVVALRGTFGVTTV
jgi:hypothetical protein